MLMYANIDVSFPFPSSSVFFARDILRRRLRCPSGDCFIHFLFDCCVEIKASRIRIPSVGVYRHCSVQNLINKIVSPGVPFGKKRDLLLRYHSDVLAVIHVAIKPMVFGSGRCKHTCRISNFSSNGSGTFADPAEFACEGKCST